MTKLWISAPTKMDAAALEADGTFASLRAKGAQIEPPGCSLCMGNQARFTADSVCFSTSTRNFPHRMGLNTKVYLGSHLVAAVCAKLGRIPTADEYFAAISQCGADKEQPMLRFDLTPPTAAQAGADWNVCNPPGTPLPNPGPLKL